MKDLREIFGAQGLLAKKFPGYRVREEQIDLAEEIANAIDDSSTLVAEAGTGIGKTWAYLVPALLKAQKVLISTGTRTLQDQLYTKDLPQVCEALGVAGNMAILKGRANYVCHYHLKRANEEEGILTHRKQVTWLRDITRFAAATRTGDKSELETVPEDADIWRLVTSTRETCLGQECPHLSDCFLYKARRQAQQADLVVVNHALFMADAALRDEGVQEILPQVDLVVFDEAHQLPDVATRFLAENVSTAQLSDWARQVRATGLAYARETVNWAELCERLVQRCKELRLACECFSDQPGQRMTREQMMRRDDVMEAVTATSEALQAVIAPLQLQAERHADLGMLLTQGLELHGRLIKWVPGASEALDEKAAGLVQWAELMSAHMRFNSAPLSVAKAFSRERRADQAWAFLSATLSVKGDFHYFISRLGLDDAVTTRHASPFDYQTQALLCVPTDLPMSDHPAYAERFAEYLMPLIRANHGKCLILCTTLRAIAQVGDALQSLFDAAGLDWPILRQGEQSRGVLLETFRKADRGVLIGSASFREGVDLAGDHLTLLAIDKLPFAPPDDPVLQARMRECRERQGNPFMQLQIPEAAIALKQGAGRLIRTERDWGVLVIGDRRIVEKTYGRRLWQGLPPFQRTREQQVVLDFIHGKRRDHADDQTGLFAAVDIEDTP